jgi:ketosteroid isomerase-like protein
LSQTNVDIARSFYAAVTRGDVPAALSLLAPTIEWREAEGFPYAGGNPYVGPDSVVQGVFLRLATEWEGFTAHPEHFFDAGESVIVTGRYTGVYRATGKSVDAQFAHVWTMHSGKAVRFQQYTDTAQVAQAISG